MGHIRRELENITNNALDTRRQGEKWYTENRMAQTYRMRNENLEKEMEYHPKERQDKLKRRGFVTATPTTRRKGPKAVKSTSHTLIPL